MKTLVSLLDTLPRALYVTAVLTFIALLFWGGRQPEVVGLIPSPYDLLGHLGAYAVHPTFTDGTMEVLAAVGFVVVLNLWKERRA